jgi:hypothetical protein
MNAVERGPMLQPGLVALKPGPGISLRQSVPIRVMDLDDARQLSGFMPIIMLIPGCASQEATNAKP